MIKRYFLLFVMMSVSFQIVAQTFTLPNGKRVSVVAGTLQTQHADALVNAANEDLAHGGGVAGALARAFSDLQRLSNEIPANKPSHYAGGRMVRCPVGTACLTRLTLPQPAIIHTVGPRGTDPDKRAMLQSAYQQSLELASREGFITIAFPQISTGIFGYPLEEATTVAVSTIVDFLSNTPTSINEVFVAVFDPVASQQKRVIDGYAQALARAIAGIVPSAVPSAPVMSPAPSIEPSVVPSGSAVPPVIPPAPIAPPAVTSGPKTPSTLVLPRPASIKHPVVPTGTTSGTVVAVSPAVVRGSVAVHTLSLKDLDKRIKAHAGRIKKTDVSLLVLRKKIKKLQAQEVVAKRAYTQAQKKHERAAILAKKKQALDRIIKEKKQLLGQQATLQAQVKKMRNDLASFQKQRRALAKKQNTELQKKQRDIEKKLKNKNISVKVRSQLKKQLSEIKRAVTKK